MFRILCLVVVLLAASSAQAELAYTYHILDLSDPSDGTKLLTLRRVNKDNQLLLHGQRLDWRADADRNLTPVTCLPSSFVRFVNSNRQGPDMRAFNNVGTVGGSELGEGGVTWGVLQAASGACTFFRGPGNARATYVTALADNGAAVGNYIDPYGTPGNPARQWHGYRRSPDGTLTPLTYGPGASVLFPSGLNLAGDVVWSARLDIPDSCPTPDDCAGTWAAGWCDSSNACTVLTAPDGHPLVPLDINNARQVLAKSGPNPNGLLGTSGWLIDLTETPADFTPLPLPPASPGYTILGVVPEGMNDKGWIVGHYLEQQVPEQCEYPWLCLRNTHEFLAIPQHGKSLKDLLPKRSKDKKD